MSNENETKTAIAKAMEEAGSVMVGENMEVKLSNGLTAVIRPLDGNDFDVAQEQTQAMGSSSSFINVSIAMATTIDGNQLVIEDLKTMKFKDRVLIQGAFSELNF